MRTGVPCNETCDTFGLKLMWSLNIWSSAIGPQLIGHPGQTVPYQFSCHGQMVPKDSVLMDKLSLEYSICPGRQAMGIRKYGDQIFGDHLSWDRIWWGNFVRGDRFYGDRLSRGTGSGEPELLGSNWFGSKCVASQNRLFLKPNYFKCIATFYLFHYV